MAKESSDLDEFRNYTGEIEYIEQPVVVARNLRKNYKVRDVSEDEEGGRRRKKTVTVKALRGINFAVNKGESVGLLGRNGSGKSTLLRLISGGEAPSSGEVLVKSQPTLLGVTPALQTYLTGRQNIYLGCLAIGMSKERASEALPAIAEWTDIGPALERPMNTYSSGMSARLSFAISTAIQPEILLVDEALSTGDAAFAEKANQRMQELLKNAGNLFLVSHAPEVIERNCTRAIWLHGGEVIADGATSEVAPVYKEWTSLEGSGKSTEAARFIQRQRASYVAPRILLDSHT
ncbi:ABC transporter ATP-binding protein [Corynebacterium lizhenjunii]|uniref:ABC transporter ATP-binding protein n=1 Tax=Corynebacterium lizhenjunii TaxID=2709394 RepID=A0A7T0KD66_9CORY|nr:ATP-binding cassette domain-containing protein [Corynebacterium lizhenjunii]QPK78593.1 ABC transporter ATP-binding protein [Corynebacterium lizhenjunii]